MTEIDNNVAVLMNFKDTQEKFNETVADTIKEIKDDLLKRPSWSVLAIISILTTACGVLLTLAIK